MPSAMTPAELRERQRTDQRMLAALDADPVPIHVSGHRSAEDVRTGNAPVPVGDPEPPAHYRVVYDFDTLRGPGSRHRPTVVHVAPLSNGGYPDSAPSAWVVSDVIPWTPHFTLNAPVCHGPGAWVANRTQLVDYVIHIGKLLNFDEPPPVPGYHGYNGAAIVYWRDQMRLQPLSPDLRFPSFRLEDVINADVTATATNGTPATTRMRRAGSAPSAPAAGTGTAAAIRFRPAVRRDERRFRPARP